VELKLSPNKDTAIDMWNASVNMIMFSKNKDMLSVRNIMGNSCFGAHESILNGVLSQTNIYGGLL